MYNIKHIYRQKNYWLLIGIFIFIFLMLIFLFKYIFVVQDYIEASIYDKNKNRVLIVTEDYNITKDKFSNLSDVLYIYPDYQIIELESTEIGLFNITPLLFKEMPNLIFGDYPENKNDILLPKYIFKDGKRLDLKQYVGKTINVMLNNYVEWNFHVSGIYDSQNEFFAIYNLENINYLLKQLPSYDLTGNSRILINHYKSIEKIQLQIGSNVYLNDFSGITEIQVYNSLYNMLLTITVIISIFILVILIVVSSILLYYSRCLGFIQFTQGYTAKTISKNYVDLFFKIMVVSLLIALSLYFILGILYKKAIYTNNLVLNYLFNLSVNYYFLIPIIILIVIFSFILYLLIYFIINRYVNKN